jgi:type IV secretory pathway VirB2 component (pilin)
VRHDKREGLPHPSFTNKKLINFCLSSLVHDNQFFSLPFFFIFWKILQLLWTPVPKRVSVCATIAWGLEQFFGRSHEHQMVVVFIFFFFFS